MEAIIKSTGEKVNLGDFVVDINGREIWFEDIEFQHDYWTRLEHQAAIAAMQALLSSDTMMGILSRRDNGTMEEEVAREAFDYAHALVEKYKKEGK